MTFLAITSTAQSEADGSQPDFIFHAATFIFITSHNHRNTQLVVRLCSPRYPGEQEQEALSPALSQRPPFRQRIFRHGSLQISQCLPACTHTKRAFNNSPGSTFSTLKHIRIHSHTHIPSNWGVQTHSQALMRSLQVAQFWQGADRHSLYSSSQYKPWQP